MSAQQNQLQNVTPAEFAVFMHKYDQDAVSRNEAKVVAIRCFFRKEWLCDGLLWGF